MIDPPLQIEYYHFINIMVNRIKVYNSQRKMHKCTTKFFGCTLCNHRDKVCTHHIESANIHSNWNVTAFVLHLHKNDCSDEYHLAYLNHSY